MSGERNAWMNEEKNKKQNVCERAKETEKKRKDGKTLNHFFRAF